MEDKINLLLTLFAFCRTPATRALSLIRRRVELKALLLSVRKSVMALNYNSKFLLQQERFLFLCLLVLAIIIADNKHSWLNWTRVSRDICPVFSFGHSTVHLKYLLISSSYWTSPLRSLPVAVNCLDACRWLLSPKLETCSSRWCGKTERTNDLLSMLIVYAEVRWYASLVFPLPSYHSIDRCIPSENPLGSSWLHILTSSDGEAKAPSSYPSSRVFLQSHPPIDGWLTDAVIDQQPFCNVP